MSALLKSLRLKDYRSYQSCHVDFDRATVLVGPNGAGKSNLIDALHFLSDAVNLGLDAALTARGGITAIRRRIPRDARPTSRSRSPFNSRSMRPDTPSRSGPWRAVIGN